MVSPTGLKKYLCLVIVVALMLVLAYFGHSMIQAFERDAAPVLTVIFVVGGSVILSRARVSGGGGSGFGGLGTPGDDTATLPTWLGKITLLGITLLGITLAAIAANAVNVYSSAISFAAMGSGCGPARSGR